MRVILPLWVLTLGLLGGAAAAAADALDAEIRAELARRRIPGCAVAVLRPGQAPRLRAYGLASVEHAVPVTTDTIFELTSITKIFTATAVMTLVTDGRLGLDDLITRHLVGAPSSWAGITVRHLLTHTSGIAPPLSFATLYRPRQPQVADYSARELFESAIRDAVRFGPGDRYAYRDTNYFLLAMIIERVSGESYGDFLARRFFRPLGMTATSVPGPWQVIRRRATGYTLRDGALARIRRDGHVELGGHLGVFSSVADLARFDAALDAGRVLPSAAVAQMWTPVTLNNGVEWPQGLGWRLSVRRGHRMLSHGGISGVDWVKLPDQGVTIITLGNLGNLTADANPDVNYYMAEFLAPRVVTELAASRAARQPDPAPARAQRYLEALAAFARGETPSAVTGPLGLVLGELGPEGRRTTERRLAERRAFTYITSDDVRGRGVKHLGVPVARVDHYELVTDHETRYYSFAVTENERLADMRAYTE